VVQGVLPFPGQGLVDLQQGVLVGCLEELNLDTPFFPPAVAMSVADAAAPPHARTAVQMPPHVPTMMPGPSMVPAVRTAPEGPLPSGNGFGGYPPSKRVAATSADEAHAVQSAARRHAQLAEQLDARCDEASSDVPKVASHLRADYSGSVEGTAMATEPAYEHR